MLHMATMLHAVGTCSTLRSRGSFSSAFSIVPISTLSLPDDAASGRKADVDCSSPPWSSN